MNTTTEPIDAYELALRIAPHLGPDWRSVARTDDHAPYLKGPGAAKLMLHLNDGWCAKGRVAVSGCWPQFADGRTWSPATEERVDVTFDANRDPKTIASGIKRRLLPVYEKALRRAVEYIGRSDAARARAEEAAGRIAYALGNSAHAKPPAGSEGISHVWPGIPGLPHQLKVRPNYDAGPRVCFDVETDEKTALKILALLKEGRHESD